MARTTRRLLIGALIASLAFIAPGANPGHARAASPLVDVAWLDANGARADVVVLDVRNRIGGATARTYRAGHVPGAVYSDYLRAGWRATVDGVPGQLPAVADLERLIGGLGIGNDSHVVIVAGGVSANDMSSATRVYWTFKVLGHDAVSILDGGYRAYAAARPGAVETGWNEPVAKVFKARPRPAMVADYRDVMAARAAGTALIDARPPGFYRGKRRSRAVARAGTIPPAVNVPEGALTADDGRFVGPDRVAALLRAVGLGVDDPAITFCNTGHWASLAWFAESEILGNKKVRLYDGSMADWAHRADLPVEPGTRGQ